MTKSVEIKDKTAQSEGIKIDVFRKNIRKTVPHKHNNYFEIIYLTKWTGSHTIDTKEYTSNLPVIFTIRKEQVHYWDITSEPEGFVLLLKKTFLQECLDPSIKLLISELSAQNCLYPKEDSAIALFTLLLEEYRAPKTKNKPLIIEGLLKALLAKLLSSSVQEVNTTGSNSIVEKFNELLNQENNLHLKVKDYAALLHTTPQNLNAICRKKLHQSANELISEHIINEAKRLLLYTESSVNEIAYQLDFKDNSHFSKYFKRNVGKTPLSYRNENN